MNYFAIILVVLMIIGLFKAVVNVKQGFNATVERFGRFTTVLNPGLHFLVPFVDRVGNTVNMMESVLDVQSQDVITKDNAGVRADGVVFYQVLDAAKAAYEVRDLERAITNLTVTNIRTVMGSMDLDELLSHRETINAKLLSVVDQATSPWGVKITRIEIKDITPPRDLLDSMARQMKAERDKRAQILTAEGHRQAQILEAEGHKASAMLEAEGKKEAEFRKAEARERAAEAEAKATKMVSDAISKGNMQAINYFVAQNYVKSLEKMASAKNAKTIFMPLESSNMIGALGGIAEIAKDAFKGSDSPQKGKTSVSLNR